MTTDVKINTDDLFKAGLHLGSIRSRRHPTAKPFILGVKNDHEIIDIEKTAHGLTRAKEFVRELAKAGKTILFVGNKSEAKKFVWEAAVRIGAPYVAERWIGGTMTNFDQIKRRTARLTELKTKSEKGELSVYTKRERGRIMKELSDLERYFSGIVEMKELPKALFVVDSKKEAIAVAEARLTKIPVVSLSNSDCDLSKIDYPIVGNDRSTASISFIVNAIADAYLEGKNLKS